MKLKMTLLNKPGAINILKGMTVAILQSVLFCCCIVFPARAQTQNNISNEQINVVKDYKPTLSDAVKISSLPQPDTSKPELPILDYTVNTRKLSAQIPTPALKPFKLKDESIPKLYKSYARLGFGNYLTPYGEVFFNSLRAKNFVLSAHIKHISSSAQIADLGDCGFSRNEAELVNSPSEVMGSALYP
jgi:hypothetical protein